MKLFRFLLYISLLSIIGCGDGPGQRADFDETIGSAAAGDTQLSVRDGLALVEVMEAGRLDLWLSAPTQEITFTTGPFAVPDWDLTLRNAPADSVLSIVTGDATAVEVTTGLPTEKHWRLRLPPDAVTTVHIAPPDAWLAGPVRIAMLSDIQEAMSQVQDMFARINDDPSIRFVLSAGDITDNGSTEEYDRFRRELRGLHVPFYATCGNHDVSIGDMIWHRQLGRHSFHFNFKGAAFTLADSADATIDPKVYRWLDAWLDDAQDRWHLFITHLPPVDPNGVRNGSFSSRREAAKLISALARGAVDLAVFGHIHTHVAYTLGGIECHISGGGGGWPMRWDGLARHFLTMDIDPVAQDHDVKVVEIP
ncbi:metallophosphoesterase [Myxococcota bacterium]|nr:metallophosphoesterase [Myxococcota bacterium]